MSYTNESYLTHEPVTTHIQMSHVSHTNESCHCHATLHKWFTSHIPMSHVTPHYTSNKWLVYVCDISEVSHMYLHVTHFTNVMSRHTIHQTSVTHFTNVTHINESCPTVRVTSHVTRTNDSCHTGRVKCCWRARDVCHVLYEVNRAHTHVIPLLTHLKRQSLHLTARVRCCWRGAPIWT